MALGPPDAVAARADGPAACLVAGPERAVAAYAVSADGNRSVQVAELGTTEPPTVLAVAPGRSPRPPVALVSPEGGLTVAWRETARGEDGRILWSEAPTPGRGLSEPRELSEDAGSDPRGGGRPTVLRAVLGAPPGAGSIEADLGLWQRVAGEDGGYQRLGAPIRGRALGYAAVGLGPGAAVTATVVRGGDLVLAAVSAEGDTVRTPFPGRRPAGPSPVWLATHDGVVVAGWSERTFGRSGHAAVELTRSTDGGVSWSAPHTFMRSRDGLHPLASFAQDEATIAVVWRASDGIVERILLCVSTDFGATFSPPVAVDSGVPDRKRSRPRVAVRERRVLVAWQEAGDPQDGIYASLSDDLGDGLEMRAEPVARSTPERSVRNPQPWLLPRGGGVLWESARVDTPAPGRPPAGSSTVALHVRSLRG